MKKSSVMETPESPFKKGGPPFEGPGIKRDGENPSLSQESTVEGTLKAFKIIIDHPAVASAMGELGHDTSK